MITLLLIFHCDMTTLVMKEEEQFGETRSQQTRYNNPILAKCWSIADVEPTLGQHPMFVGILNHLVKLNLQANPVWG